MGMNPAESLQPDETHAVLSGALRELEGVDARLEGWAADDTFTPFGKRRVVRYELEARLAGTPHVRRYRWLGKFYDRDEDARRVGAVLRPWRLRPRQSPLASGSCRRLGFRQMRARRPGL